MKVLYFLELFGERNLSLAEPEGRQVVEQLNIHSATKYHASTLTATDALKLIRELPEGPQTKVLTYELNDGLNLVDLRHQLQKAADTGAGSTLRLVTSFLMGLLVLCTSAGFTWMVVSVGLETNIYPDWTVMALPFLIPGMILWHIFGVLTKERKDSILMAMGNRPTTTTTWAGVAESLIAKTKTVDPQSTRPRL